MREVAVALLTLPDDRLVLQRRTKDAPRSPGCLGLFGGGLDEGEARDAAMHRELQEETDLSLADVRIVFQDTLEVEPDTMQHSEAMRVHLYLIHVPSADFAVFEGDGAEAYTIDELQARTDLSAISKRALHKVFGGTYGA